MFRSFFKYALAIMFITFSVGAYAEDGMNKTVKVSPEDIVDRIIEDSFKVKQYEMDVLAAYEGIPAAKGTFDTMLSMDMMYNLNKEDSTSTIMGDRKDTTVWGLSLSKEIPTGTELGLSFDTNVSKTYNATVNGIPIIPQTNLYDPIIGFSLSQPLMQNVFGMIDRGAVKEATFFYESAENELKRRIDSQVYEALIDYWALYFNRKHIEAQKKAVSFAKEFLASTREERKLGTAEETDLLAARANLLNREDEFLTLKEIERTFEDRLRHHLELDPGTKIEQLDVLPPFENPGMFDDARISFALDNRGDYQAWKKELERLNVSLKIAKNKRWPSLDLYSTLELNQIDTSYRDALGGMDSPNWTVGMNFSVPLENRTARAGASRAKAQKARALYAVKDLENQIVNSLDTLIQEVNSRKLIVENNTQTMKLQRAKLAGEMKKYRMGRSSSYVIVQYQNDSVTSERNLVEAWLAYQDSALGLKLAEGAIVGNK